MYADSVVAPTPSGPISKAGSRPGRTFSGKNDTDSSRQCKMATEREGLGTCQSKVATEPEGLGPQNLETRSEFIRSTILWAEYVSNSN